MLEIFSYAFMQKALIAGLLISILCAIMSFFVVMKRLSFIGVGISHAAFGGVALAALIGINILWGALGFALSMAALIAYLRHKEKLHEDTLIGILFSLAMALGIVFVGLSKNYNADLFGYLFGSILSVTRSDLWIIGMLSMAVIGIVFLFFKEFLFLSFDEEMARIHGIPVNFLYFLLLELIALTVVVSIKIVGIILVSALLVIPAATARLLTQKYYIMVGISIALGVLSVILGLIFSTILDVASGAAIVIVASGFFGLCQLSVWVHHRLQKNHHSAPESSPAVKGQR